MAHISGFDGEISIVGSLDAEVVNATIVEWEAVQNVRRIEGIAKGDVWFTRFAGGRDWEANIVFLIQQITAINSVLVTSPTFTALTLKSNTNGPHWVGAAGHLENIRVRSPIDGPVTASALAVGNGAMTQTAGT